MLRRLTANARHTKTRKNLPKNSMVTSWGHTNRLKEQIDEREERERKTRKIRREFWQHDKQKVRPRLFLILIHSNHQFTIFIFFSFVVDRTHFLTHFRSDCLDFNFIHHTRQLTPQICHNLIAAHFISCNRRCHKTRPSQFLDSDFTFLIFLFTFPWSSQRDEFSLATHQSRVSRVTKCFDEDFSFLC